MVGSPSSQDATQPRHLGGGGWGKEEGLRHLKMYLLLLWVVLSSTRGGRRKVGPTSSKGQEWVLLSVSEGVDHLKEGCLRSGPSLVEEEPREGACVLAVGEHWLDPPRPCRPACSPVHVYLPSSLRPVTVVHCLPSSAYTAYTALPILTLLQGGKKPHWTTSQDYISFFLLFFCIYQGLWSEKSGEVLPQQFVWIWSVFCTCSCTHLRNSSTARQCLLLFTSMKYWWLKAWPAFSSTSLARWKTSVKRQLQEHPPSTSHCRRVELCDCLTCSVAHFKEDSSPNGWWTSPSPVTTGERYDWCMSRVVGWRLKIWLGHKISDSFPAFPYCCWSITKTATIMYWYW